MSDLVLNFHLTQCLRQQIAKLIAAHVAYFACHNLSSRSLDPQQLRLGLLDFSVVPPPPRRPSGGGRGSLSLSWPNRPENNVETASWSLENSRVAGKFLSFIESVEFRGAPGPVYRVCGRMGGHPL